MKKEKKHYIYIYVYIYVVLYTFIAMPKKTSDTSRNIDLP